VPTLPTLNALLNATATVLLVLGYRAIRRREERRHQRLMVSALCVSAAFLVSYVVYHATTGARTQFGGPPGLKPLYLTILATHVVLAATVPFLALRVAWLGWKDRRPAHRRLARWTLPIWLYVSVTGVVIWLMLYVLWAPGAAPG